MSRWQLAIPLTVFGVSGTGLFWLFLVKADEAAFRENLLPELIGFSLEGFFLVGLLSFVQELREQDRRRQLRLSLRSALRDFLSQLDLAFLERDAEPASTPQLETQTKVVLQLMSLMREMELDTDSMVALKRVAINTLPLARDLIGVAAQLSTNHLRWWIAIVEAIQKLSEAEAREEVEQPLYALLQNLAEFDSLKL